MALWLCSDFPWPSALRLTNAGSQPPQSKGEESLSPFNFSIHGGGAAVLVTPTASLVTTEGGGTATFDVALAAPPTADVTIAVSSSDLTEGTVAPASRTFTTSNWNTPQTVTITGVSDGIVDGTIAYSITTTVTSLDPVYDDLAADDVSVTNLDDGVPVELQSFEVE